MGSGLVFQSIAIPQGATITSAYLSYDAYENQGVAGVVSTIHGQLVSSASLFSTMSDFDNRFNVNGGTNHETTASVSWNSIPAWTAGQWYNSPDISSIIQEIVNQSSWVSGNNMAFCWKISLMPVPQQQYEMQYLIQQHQPIHPSYILHIR